MPVTYIRVDHFNGGGSFRLKAFIDGLVGTDEVEVRDEAVPLIDMAGHLDGNARAVLFRNAGPESATVVGNVMGSRSRIARAFCVPADRLAQEVLARLAGEQPVVELARDAAPVQQVVLTGNEADLTRLPVHLQHALDGGPYISSGLDFVIDQKTGWTNVGSRRLMLRGRHEAGIDLLAPSDLRAIYLAALERGERMPISFALGTHPVDFIAASMRLPADELALIAALRGVPLHVVRCVTNDILVPADAEMILEGYIDERGFVEPEGPYGEFFGYYGIMKYNPVFHLTAITSRPDAIFQTTTISGRHIGRTETAQIDSLRTETLAWRAMETAVREPVAVYAPPAGTGMNNLRVALRQRVPGEARNAIAALLGSRADIKHVFVVDEDIDIFSDDQMEWALSTRFQARRDMVIEDGFRAVPLDPSLDGEVTGAKAGFDLTVPFGKLGTMKWSISEPPRLTAARFQSIRQALESEPMAFGTLVMALGSDDGWEVVLELEELSNEGIVTRLPTGEYGLTKSTDTNDP